MWTAQDRTAQRKAERFGAPTMAYRQWNFLRRSSNNLNQLTKRVHETGRVYDADLEDIVQNQERLWQAATDILAVLAKLK